MTVLGRRTWGALVLLLAMGGWGAVMLWRHTVTPVSQPGAYRAYSRPTHAGWERTSRYIAMRDGVRLAADVLRPTRGGAVEQEPLPVLLQLERYHRGDGRGDERTDSATRHARVQKLLRHGYCFVSVDVRGTGASFGHRPGPFSEAEVQDSYDLCRWICAQPWCDGNIGMVGRSYGGIAQYLAASTAPPGLKAIFPEMALHDLYDFARPGGILRHDFGLEWSAMVRRLDTQEPAAPVDEDRDGTLLAAAVAAHERNVSAYELFAELEGRDAVHPQSGERIYSTRSPSSRLGDISASGVAVYHLSGWFDMWARDALQWYGGLTNPQKLLVGPWSHTDASGFSRFHEQLRWFDHWLKGVDNGVMDEAPIHYYTIGAPPGREWRSASVWPPPETVLRRYHFSAASSGTVASVVDGSLTSPAAERGANEPVPYVVDPAASSGRGSRWANGYGAPFHYPDMVENDRRCATFTSEPLEQALEVTGEPLVSLWIGSASGDADVIVYLEEVLEDGASRYVTEGHLRASHRAPGAGPLPADGASLEIRLLPTSYVFGAGHRVRVAIAGADADNLTTRIDADPWSLRPASSALVLPVIPEGAPRRVVEPRPDRRRTYQAVLAGALACVLALGVLARRSG